MCFVKEGIDTALIATDLLIKVLSSFENTRRASVAEGTRKRIRENFEKGVVRWVHIYGYRPGWVIEENEARVVRFMFDAYADAHFRYKATRVRSWSDSRFNYTETSHYAVIRGGNIGFERVPVDGSTKMADDLMESIEPFDFSDAVDFQTAYLAGYLADKYDVDAQQSIDRANQRIKQSAADAFAGTVKGYATVLPESSNILLHNGKAKYALYPVWLLNTTWKGQKYTFAMNGQTGKLVGDLPMDKSAYKKWLFGLFGTVSAALFGLSYLLWFLR